MFLSNTETRRPGRPGLAASGRSLLGKLAQVHAPAAEALLRAILVRDEGELDDDGLGHALELLGEEGQALHQATMPIADIAGWASRQRDNTSLNLMRAVAAALQGLKKPLASLLDWAFKTAGGWLRRLLARLTEDRGLGDDRGPVRSVVS